MPMFTEEVTSTQVHVISSFCLTHRVKLDTAPEQLTGKVEIKPLEATLSNSKNNGNEYKPRAIQTIFSKEET